MNTAMNALRSRFRTGLLPIARQPVTLAVATPILIWLALPLLGIAQSDTIIRATPLILTALAVAVPARAGLINVGGEGQLLIGAAAAGSFSLIVGDGLPAIIMLPLICIVGALGGLMWAGIAALLRAAGKVNETISTLLLNYVATLLLAYLVHGVLKDPKSFSFPIAAELAPSARLPLLGIGTVHIGILIALVCVALVWFTLERTRWGFRAKVVGGNAEAARRGGFRVTATVVTALLAGGALAGLAGAVELSGIEGRLRPDMAVGFGFIGFLGSWLVGHRAAWIPTAGVLLAAISVGGDSLQIDAGLPASSVYILMALVLLAVLGYRRSDRKEATA